MANLRLLSGIMLRILPTCAAKRGMRFGDTAYFMGVFSLLILLGKKMQIEIPDAIVRRAEANAGEIRLALAIQLYADNRIDYADAQQLAGLTRAAFNGELLSRAISIQQYPVARDTRHRNAG